MKQYFKRFRILYIVIAILLVLYFILFGIHNMSSKTYVRTNTECLKGDERVFDIADKLSDSEEQNLRELIKQRESQIGCDIVLVVLEEKIGSDEQALIDYADNFGLQNKFGFNEPYGDFVVLVDNWYSYGDYNGDLRMVTSGRAEQCYQTSEQINRVLDDVSSVVNDSPYEGYQNYINDVYYDMSGSLAAYTIPGVFAFLIALVITIIYIVMNLAGHKGKKTTNASTYVAGGRPDLKRKEDIFVTKNVVSRKIETNTGSGGSGGAGHHMSGGHSVGGGTGHH